VTAKNILERRFGELAEQLEGVLVTKHNVKRSYGSGDYVDNERYLNWSVKAKNLIAKACGEDALHFREFNSKAEPVGFDTNYEILVRLKAVFDAAREDFVGGYCSSVRSLVQAEVFDSELEQAKALHAAGYPTAAAVITGVVLETTLRQLCQDNRLSHGKLDKMNADLAKAGQYSVLQQKQITAMADIRNSAAHGKTENFGSEDVADMIDKVEAFVADRLS